MRPKSPVVRSPSNSEMSGSLEPPANVKKATFGSSSGPILRSCAGKATYARCCPFPPVPGSSVLWVILSARYLVGLYRKGTFVPESSHSRTGRFASDRRASTMSDLDKSRSEEHTSELQSLRHLVC